MSKLLSKLFRRPYRHHIIKTGLPRGYYDEDTLILHACMAMLCRYVEWYGTEEEMEKFNAELRDPACDPNAPPELSEGQAARQEEALAIYRWWKYTKPANDKRLADLELLHYGTKYIGATEVTEALKEMRELETKILEDEQSMLHRLINIRPGLWT